MEAPTVICPHNSSTVTDFGQPTAVVTWNDLQATDNSGQSPTVTCSTGSGSQFGIGETKVICQAVDPSENQAVCTFTVNIEGNNILFFNEFILSVIQQPYVV